MHDEDPYDEIWAGNTDDSILYKSMFGHNHVQRFSQISVQTRQYLVQRLSPKIIPQNTTTYIQPYILIFDHLNVTVFRTG